MARFLSHQYRCSCPEPCCWARWYLASQCKFPRHYRSRPADNVAPRVEKDAMAVVCDFSGAARISSDKIPLNDVPNSALARSPSNNINAIYVAGNHISGGRRCSTDDVVIRVELKIHAIFTASLEIATGICANKISFNNVAPNEPQTNCATVKTIDDKASNGTTSRRDVKAGAGT